jgi:hypothetical protein
MKAIPKKLSLVVVLMFVASIILGAMFVPAAPVQASAPASVQESPKLCAPGECEATYGWKDVDKVTKMVDHWSCPAGYIDEGVSGCKKKVEDKEWKCPNGYSPTSSFPDGDHACKKNGQNKYASAELMVTGWHWEYADKVNNPTPELVCPSGSESHGNGCRQWVQTGWKCNCGANQHEDGNGHCVDNPTCPTGQVGTPPNCHVPTCEELGNCPPPTCPTGQVGTPPNCHVPTCEELGNCPMCKVPGLEDIKESDIRCKDPDPGCTYVEGEMVCPDPGCKLDPTNPMKQICKKNDPYTYQNFQNDIKEFCADPIWSLLVPWEDQVPKDKNDVTIKFGGLRRCSTTDESHSGKNDGGCWEITNGQWTLVGGDYYAQSKYIDALATTPTAMCAVYTDKDPMTGKVLDSSIKDGKVVRVFHQGKLEKNGFYWWRWLDPKSLLLDGSYCPDGEVYDESVDPDTDPVIHRARKLVEGKPLTDIVKFTSPAGRPLWSER